MRIILHGGYKGDWDNAHKDLALFKKLIEAAEAADKKILISLVAYKNPSEFAPLEKMLATFKKMAPHIKIVVGDRSNLRTSLPKHKVLFLQGGNSLEQIKFFADFTAKEIGKGKALIAGSSAGASILCQFGYTGSSKKPLKGKGIAKVAVMPHATGWPVKKYLADLRKTTSLPIILVNENEFIELDT